MLSGLILVPIRIRWIYIRGVSVGGVGIRWQRAVGIIVLIAVLIPRVWILGSVRGLAIPSIGGRIRRIGPILRLLAVAGLSISKLPVVGLPEVRLSISGLAVVWLVVVGLAITGRCLTISGRLLRIARSRPVGVLHWIGLRHWLGCQVSAGRIARRRQRSGCLNRDRRPTVRSAHGTLLRMRKQAGQMGCGPVTNRFERLR